MDLQQLREWTMWLLSVATVIVCWKVALRRPNQWKALVALLGFALVGLGALSGRQWLSALTKKPVPVETSEAPHAKASDTPRDLHQAHD